MMEKNLPDDLQTLLDERDCARLVAQYCHLIDHGQAASIADLFSEDGVWSSAKNTLNGREEIRAGFQVRQDASGRISRHVCCNAVMDIQDEAHASGVVYIALYRHDGEPGRSTSPAAAPSVVGEYRDAFVRTSDGWRFARRDFVAAFSDD
jgi:hypothetical protein